MWLLWETQQQPNKKDQEKAHKKEGVGGKRETWNGRCTITEWRGDTVKEFEIITKSI